MPTNRKYCDLCRSNDLNIIYKNISDYETNIEIKVDLLECKDCGLIQQSKIFSEIEIEQFYLDDYHGRNYNKKNNFLEKLSSRLRGRYYQRFINILISNKIPKDVRILDFGSGDGFLAHQLIKNGYFNIYCCDFFKPDYNSSNINYLHPNSISESRIKFDVLFMLNSIEHLVSFSREFDNLVNLMNDNSNLIIETPNFDSPDSYIFRKFWGGLHQPRHTYLWTKNSLLNHLSYWGFTSVNKGSPQSAHWAISVQNFLSANFRFFKSFVVNGRFPGYLILVIIFFPIGIIQNFFGRESVINIFAKLKKTKHNN